MAYLRQDNLVIPQGATWAVRWPLEGYQEAGISDFTGWAVRSHVRRQITSAEILHEWSSVLGNAVIEDSYIELRVSAEESSAWTWFRNQAVYDVELVSPGGEVFRVTQGTITVSPEVTR